MPEPTLCEMRAKVVAELERLAASDERLKRMLAENAEDRATAEAMLKLIDGE